MIYWARLAGYVATRMLTAIIIYAHCSSLSHSAQLAACRGIWAASGQIPYTAVSGRTASIRSPSGTDTITPTDGGLAYAGAIGTMMLVGLIGNPPVTEILWAQDSKAFVINESDGGLVGSWLPHYFTIDSGRPIERSMDVLLRKLSTNGSSCDGEMMNYGIAGWIGENAPSFLLIREVPPHSSCQHMGVIVGAKVSVAQWAITEILSEKDIKAQWPGLLGCRHNGPDAPEPTRGQ